MKKILILAASPRKNGNTNSIVKEVAAEFEAEGRAEYEIVDIAELDIKPCLSCRCCQTDWDDVFCVQEDDVTSRGVFDEKESLFDKISGADMLVLATPIYSWYCTPPLKALLDRCVYAFNKYYDDVSGTHGGERGPALWAGKKVALIITCGYPPEKGADILEEGIRRYCTHSQLEYVGSIVERNAGYVNQFMDEDKVERAKAFAGELLGKL